MPLSFGVADTAIFGAVDKLDVESEVALNVSPLLWRWLVVTGSGVAGSLCTFAHVHNNHSCLPELRIEYAYCMVCTLYGLLITHEISL